MGKRPQPRQGERQDPRSRSTTGISDEPDTARIVFVSSVIERDALVGVHSGCISGGCGVDSSAAAGRGPAAA
jgi:hypothetical protein